MLGSLLACFAGSWLVGSLVPWLLVVPAPQLQLKHPLQLPRNSNHGTCGVGIVTYDQLVNWRAGFTSMTVISINGVLSRITLAIMHQYSTSLSTMILLTVNNQYSLWNMSSLFDTFDIFPIIRDGCGWLIKICSEGWLNHPPDDVWIWIPVINQ